MTGTLLIKDDQRRWDRLTPSFALRLDAVVSGLTGVTMLALAGPLGDLLDLPVNLLRGAGAMLLVLIVGLGWLGSQRTISRTALYAVAGINIVWAVESVVLLLTGWVEPNGFGIAFVLFQAVVVLILAELQVTVARRAIR